MEIFGKLITNNLEFIGVPVDNLYYLKFLNRFKTKLVLDDITNCWNWTGGKNGRGDYGLLNFDNNILDIHTNFQVHRLSYTLFCGEISNGMIVRHICNNGLCANPEHLQLGTLSDNSLDMVKSGNSTTNTTDIQKLQMVSMRASGIMVKDIATTFNISRKTVSNILSGKLKTAHLGITLDNSINSGTTDAQKLDMVKMRDAGAELKEIATKHNVSISCVSRILGGKRKTAHLGIGVHESSYTTDKHFPPSTTKLTESQVFDIISAWNMGNSIIKISQEYQVNRTTISDIINKKSWKYVTKNIDIRKYEQPQSILTQK